MTSAPKKRVKVSYRIRKRTKDEKRLKIKGYEVYTENLEETLASLRAAEKRREVTNIRVEGQ